MTQPSGGSTALLDDVMTAFNAHDLDAIMGFFADDCTFDTARGPFPWGGRLVGKEAVRAGIAERFDGMPDVHYEPIRNVVADGVGFSEWEPTGTAPDGTALRVRGVDHWEFEGDLITRKDAYWKIVDAPAERD